jgi:hypothetical protein
MSDPRSLGEALDNTLHPFRITPNSFVKCECGHSVGFHHFTGLCKGSVTDGCQCEKVRPVD